jgi:hypothetical protein
MSHPLLQSKVFLKLKRTKLKEQKYALQPDDQRERKNIVLQYPPSA